MKNIIFILSSLIILASCSSKESSNTTNNRNLKSGNPVASTTYTQDIDATSSKIKETEEFKGCMKQQANMCIQTVGSQVAQKTKDPAFCKELSSPEQQSSCRFAITMVNAQEKNDIKLCDTLTDANYQKQCQIQLYRQEALTKGDISICDKMSSLMQATGSSINIDANMQKNQCVMQVIMSGSGKTEKDCEKISDARSVEMCKTVIKTRSTNPIVPAPTIPTPARVPSSPQK